jgi:diguanylate cyclase (GGDEF)-like protein
VKVILATMLVSIAFGYAGGGRLTNFSKVRILLAPLAIVGLALQLVVPPGPWPLVLLLVSFGMLLTFGIVNRRVPGFRLILLGTMLNLLVIAVNQGMPVARRALIDSGQQDTLTELVHGGGAKHHLAGPDDKLVFLGDVIALPPPVGQIVSIGDLLTYGGVAWLIVIGMLGEAWERRRRRWWLWIRSRLGDGAETGDDPGAEPSDRSPHDRRMGLRAMEAAVVLPFIAWLAVEIARDPRQFLDWRILVWAAAIAVIDLLPVTASSDLAFSLSFPVELTAALLYFPPVAALIAFIGAFDTRELRGELPPMKALYIRGQIGFSVATESLVFHLLTSLHARWFVIGPTVMLAAVAGYAVNVLVVATYAHLQRRETIGKILLEMHVGVFGEFVISYMGLALFSVLVAITTETIGLWALVVFIAPLAFARQMFQRTHSLEVATNELAARQAENEHQALHDALTGLPNRVLFHQHLIEAIDATRGPGDTLAVMLMDLDHFKEINDTLGHHFGDMLLKQIGPRLSSVLREGDVMARLGGDEFGILLPDLPSPETVLTIVHRLLVALEEPVAVEGLALGISGSIGIAMFPEHSSDAESLLRRADVAMYASKESGGGYEFYHEDLDRHSPAQLELIGSVRPALEAGEFVLYYQPKVRFSDGAVAGAEALIRWQHPKLGLLMPDAFIPFVERTVLLRPLTQYVINEALRQWGEWSDLGTRLEVAVNVSPRSLLDQQLPSQVAAALETWGVPPEFLKLELTESFLMSDSGRSTAVLEELSRIGVGLSIDDFGTGYSSLSHLKRLPIQEIKIDRSFVMNMLRDPNDAMIVRATVELGQNLGMRVVAEGVEDRETWDLLESFGCDEAQGYFFSPPLQRDEFRRWASVRTGMPLPAIHAFERGLSLEQS